MMVQTAGKHIVVPTDEHRLITRARQGDEIAIRALVQKHNRLLFRLVRGYVDNDADAEDIVQETYVRAFCKLDGFREDSAFSTWLSRIAINEALGKMRKDRPTLDWSALENAGAIPDGGKIVMFPTTDPPKSPETEAARQQIRLALERVIDRLPPKFRTVFILRDVEGLSTEETSSHLMINPKTVKTRLHRARRLMRDGLAKEFTSGFAGAFPFDGERCAHMGDRVVTALGRAGFPLCLPD